MTVIFAQIEYMRFYNGPGEDGPVSGRAYNEVNFGGEH